MKYFIVQEFVNPRQYKLRGNKAITLMDGRIITFVENLREELNTPITINNWHLGGKYDDRGHRDIHSEVYSEFSQHSCGRGIDLTAKGYTGEQLRAWVIANRHYDWIKPITFIEGEVSWLHVDCRYSASNDLVLYNIHSETSVVYKR